MNNNLGQFKDMCEGKKKVLASNLIQEYYENVIFKCINITNKILLKTLLYYF